MRDKNKTSHFKIIKYLSNCFSIGYSRPILSLHEKTKLIEEYEREIINNMLHIDTNEEASLYLCTIGLDILQLIEATPTIKEAKTKLPKYETADIKGAAYCGLPIINIDVSKSKLLSFQHGLKLLKKNITYFKTLKFNVSDWNEYSPIIVEYSYYDFVSLIIPAYDLIMESFKMRPTKKNLIDVEKDPAWIKEPRAQEILKLKAQRLRQLRKEGKIEYRSKTRKDGKEYSIRYKLRSVLSYSNSKS